MSARPTRDQVRRRQLAALAVLAIAVIGLVAALTRGGGGSGGSGSVLAWSPDHSDELAARAAAGFSDPVWEKSPGGAIATARRVARWRPLIERAARAQGVDPDTLEGIVFLESAGRRDAIAGGDLQGAVGLTQIVASTATSLLHMHVDLARARALTARIAAATNPAKQRQLERARERADQRFDPQASLAAAARYLAQARKVFGRADLAVASYHMGIGNLQQVLRLYKSDGGGSDPSYAQVYFDTTPLRRPRAQALLSGFSDESSTYLWRVMAAEAIMKLSRDDPAKLAHLAALEEDGGPAERRLYPKAVPPAPAIQKPQGLEGVQLTQRARATFAPTPSALAALRFAAGGTRTISKQAPLIVTNAHGVRVELARRYRSRRQALAFQFMLDRLQAWNLIAWGRSGQTLAIVAGEDAARLLRDARID